MRPRIVDYLNDASGMNVFDWLVPIPSVIYAITFILVVVIFVKRCKDAGLNRGTALDIAFWGGITGIVGARLFFLAFYQKGFLHNPLDVFSTGGTTSWGVYMGVFIGAILYLRIKGKPTLPYLDAVASCLPLGTFVGRWSCFMYGCDYGTITDVAWGVRYPVGSRAFAAHVNEHLIEPISNFSATVHPNQIYLSINALALFIFMTWFWKKYKHIPGLSFGVFWLVYSLSRFSLEFFRDVPASNIIPALNSPQMVCLSLLSLSVSFVVILNVRNKLIYTNRN